MDAEPAHIKTGLFVDYDNMVNRLADEVGHTAALAFRSKVAQWLAWLQQGRHQSIGNAATPPRPRQILVRRCYINPSQDTARDAFVRTGFLIRDCPKLTKQGKNAADIYMAMDVLDALEHHHHLQEFIILSADSDFTPVLLRLREHDRRTALIATRDMAAALRAACDVAIAPEDFAAQALGVGKTASAAKPAVTGKAAVARPDTNGAGSAPRNAPAARQESATEATARANLVKFVIQELAAASEPIRLNTLGNRIPAELRSELMATKLLKRGRLSQLLESLATETGCRLEKHATSMFLLDPTRHRLKPPAASNHPFHRNG